MKFLKKSKTELPINDLVDSLSSLDEFKSRNSSIDPLNNDSIDFSVSTYFNEVIQDFNDWSLSKLEKKFLEIEEEVRMRPSVEWICMLATCHLLLGNLMLSEIHYKKAYKAVALKDFSDPLETDSLTPSQRTKLDWILYCLFTVYRKQEKYILANQCAQRITGKNEYFFVAKAIAGAISNDETQIKHFLQLCKPTLTEDALRFVEGEIYFIKNNPAKVIEYLTPLVEKNPKLFCGRHLALRILAFLQLSDIPNAASDVTKLYYHFPTLEYKELQERVFTRSIELIKSAHELDFKEVTKLFLDKDEQTQKKSNCAIDRSKHALFKVNKVLPVSAHYEEDFFEIQNNGKDNVYFTISPSKSGKYFLILEPDSGRIAPNTKVYISCKLKMLCTAKVGGIIRINLETKNKEATQDLGNLYTYFSVESELSPYIDFDEIELKEVIGRGGLGIVYRGIWRTSQVAVKQLQTIDNFESRELQKEIQIASTLKHPHIARYIGVTLGINELPCILMEYIAGGTLTKLLSRPITDLKFKCKLALDIINGMTFLHRNSIAHRDLKPDNILVFSEDPATDCNLKLTDFGSSKIKAKGNYYYVQTLNGKTKKAKKKMDAIKRISKTHLADKTPNEKSVERTVINDNDGNDEKNLTHTKGEGTILYQSPEILSGNTQYNLEKADVFSFGVTLWQIITQKVPFFDIPEYQNYKSWDITKFITEGRRLELPEETHKKIKELYEKCVHQVPEQRPLFSGLQSSFSELHSQLFEFKLEKESNIGWAGAIDRGLAEEKLKKYVQRTRTENTKGAFLVRYSYNKHFYVISYVASYEPELIFKHIGEISVDPNTGALTKINVLDQTVRHSKNLITYIEELQNEGALTKPLSKADIEEYYERSHI